MAILPAFVIAGFVALILNALKITLKWLNCYDYVKHFYPFLAMILWWWMGYCYWPTTDAISNVIYGILAGWYAVGLYQWVSPKLYNENIDAKQL